MKNKVKIDEALERIYLVKSQGIRKKGYVGYLCLPMCLVGKRVKIIIINDKEVKNVKRKNKRNENI